VFDFIRLTTVSAEDDSKYEGFPKSIEPETSKYELASKYLQFDYTILDQDPENFKILKL
jgi:hypothetical protein